MDARAARPPGGCIGGSNIQGARGITRDRWVLAVSTFLRPYWGGPMRSTLSTGCARGGCAPRSLHPWLQPCAPSGRGETPNEGNRVFRALVVRAAAPAGAGSACA